MAYKKQYTLKQKLAYYRRKYNECSGKPTTQRRSKGEGSFSKKEYEDFFGGNGRYYIKGRGNYRVYKPGRTYVQGRGNYFSKIVKRIPKNFFNAPKWGSMLGAAGGTAIGNVIAPGVGGEVGARIGAAGGEALGKLFKSITGWGNYRINENNLLFPQRLPPAFGEDTIRVRKREFIAKINATTAFTNNSFPINPGLSEVFPWLSALANNYEQYHFNGLLFEYVSTSSDAIASTTNLGLGQVMLATEYNAMHDLYQDSPQMLGAMFSNSGRPSENIMHAVECAPNEVANNLYYVRSGDPPTDGDLRLYDLGNFQIATDNMPANYSGMGQLWVTYDVTFYKSIMNNQIGSAINTDKWVITGAASASPFGTTRTLAEGSNIGTEIASGTKILFPPVLESGYYLMLYQITGPNAATTMNNFTITATNASLKTCWRGNTVNEINNDGMSAASAVLVYFTAIVVTITDRDASVTFAGDGTLPGSATSCDLLITQVNGDIFNDLSFASSTTCDMDEEDLEEFKEWCRIRKVKKAEDTLSKIKGKRC